MRWLVFLTSMVMFSPMALADSDGTVLILGDSLTAGYGLVPDQAYPARLQEKIDAVGLSFRIMNAGLSGDTSAGGLRRVDWLLRDTIDVLILALGANDGLRGIPLESTKKNLHQIIQRTRQHSPDVEVILAGMLVPPNLGGTYVESFRSLFSELAAEDEVQLIPFLLEGVAGDRSLNLEDGIHPNPKGHQLVADNVWRTLEPVLRSLANR